MGQLSFLFRAVVFDLDGVIIDSEWYYFNLLEEFSREFDLGITTAERHAMVGNSAQEFTRHIQAWWERAGRGRVAPQEALDIYFGWAATRRADYAALLNPGVAETIDTLRERGVRVALASSSLMVNIKSELAECGLSDAFELIVSGEQFRVSKPNPQIYLHTVDELGLQPQECCCVEDSAYGIEAGKRAGLYVVAKREPRFDFSQDEADAFIDEIPDLLRIEPRSA